MNALDFLSAVEHFVGMQFARTDEEIKNQCAICLNHAMALNAR
jgi:hypothetical protein